MLRYRLFRMFRYDSAARSRAISADLRRSPRRLQISIAILKSCGIFCDSIAAAAVEYGRLFLRTGSRGSVEPVSVRKS